MKKTCDKVNDVVRLCASIPILILFAVFAVYLFKKKRVKRFEITILVILTLKYINWVITIILADQIEQSNFLITITQVLFDSPGPVSHWVYASQYM